MVNNQENYLLINQLQEKALYLYEAGEQIELIPQQQQQKYYILYAILVFLTYILLLCIRYSQPKAAQCVQKCNLYKYTDKMKKLYNIVEFECTDCNIQILNTIHSDFSNICLYDYNHMCPWVGKDIYLLNIIPFYWLCNLLFWISTYDLINNVKEYINVYHSLCKYNQNNQKILNYIQRTKQNGFCLNPFESIILTFISNQNHLLYTNVSLLLDILVCVPALAQVLGQFLSLFYVYNYDQQMVFKQIIKSVKKSDYRLVETNKDYYEIIALTEKDINSLKEKYNNKNVEFKIQGNDGKYYQVLSKKQSLKLLKKEKSKKSFRKLQENIYACRFMM